MGVRFQFEFNHTFHRFFVFRDQFSVILIKNHAHKIEGIRLGSYSGRPKEEGGHKDWHLTFDKVTTESLEKIRKGGGNASEALEKAFKPIAEKYDPGELSIHIWRYENYLSKQIIKAAQEGKTETVQALASLATALRDYRSLCGIPPPNFHLPCTEKPKEVGFWATPRSKTSVWNLLFTAITIIVISLFSLPIFVDFARMPTPEINTTVWNSTAQAFEWIRPRLIVVPFVILFVGILLLLACVFEIRRLLRKRTLSIFERKTRVSHVL